MKKNTLLVASSMAFLLLSCGGAKQAVKSLTAVEQPQAQVTVAAKEVNLTVANSFISLSSNGMFTVKK